MQALIAYMVFSGMLLKPGGKAPAEPGAAFATWQFWAVVAGLVVARAFMYWWDFVRGGEADVIPPEAAVAEPLRRLFVLQFGILAGGLLVYWVFHSALAGLIVLLLAKTAADLVLAVFERLRAARIRGGRGGRHRATRVPPSPGRRSARHEVAASAGADRSLVLARVPDRAAGSCRRRLG